MLIGIDAGGTSTRAVVLDRSGACRGWGSGPGGNPVSRGPADAARAIGAAVTAAVADLGAREGRGGPGRRVLGTAVRGRSDVPDGGPAILAMAGASTSAATAEVVAGVRDAVGVRDVEIVSDIAAMFASGTPERSGYVLVAGTGAAAQRIEDGETAATADGLGWLLGDAGSGFWIGRRAVRAALAALSGGGPQTALAPLFAESLGAGARGPWSNVGAAHGRPAVVAAAVDALYARPPVELARYAVMVFTAAKISTTAGSLHLASFPDGGDPVAVGILREARAHLLTTLGAVRTSALRGPVVLGGTIAHRLPGLAAAIAHAFGSPPPAVHAVADGVVGAAVLALRRSGVTVDRAVFDRVTSTAAALRG